MLQAEQESAEEEAVGYSPLHACWSGLLQSMLTAGLVDPVLRALDAALPAAALLTTEEAQQLVEHSRALPHQG